MQQLLVVAAQMSHVLHPHRGQRAGGQTHRAGGAADVGRGLRGGLDVCDGVAIVSPQLGSHCRAVHLYFDGLDVLTVRGEGGVEVLASDGHV